MHYRLLIAWRYFFARRHRSVVNIISRISLGGISVCAFSLIVVLSVYNGIGKLTVQLFNIFDPELLIEATDDKQFCCSDAVLAQLRDIDGIDDIAPIVEEKAWAIYRNHQAIIQLRGIDNHYTHQTGIDTLLADGLWLLGQNNSDNVHHLVLGSELYYRLGISRYSNSTMQLLIPRRSGAIGTSLEDAFNSSLAYPTGYFVVQQDIDNRYAVCDIALVRQLLDYSDDTYTALSVSLLPNANQKNVRLALTDILHQAYPDIQFQCRNRMEQQPLYYKIFQSERLAIYLILSLITLVASLTLVASIRLLIIDKRNSSNVLQAIGLTERDVRNVYTLQGMMIVATGCIVGLIIGIAVCLIQQHYGIVKMGENFVTQSFPVAIRGIDILYVLLIVMVIGILAVVTTVRHTKV